MAPVLEAGVRGGTAEAGGGVRGPPRHVLPTGLEGYSGNAGQR